MNFSRRIRVDRLLVERGLVASRAKAQELIARGGVSIGTRRVTRASEVAGEDADLVVTEALRFVSRGGDKLDGALADLGVGVAERVCLDVGASTGGFTDCLLQRGARRVYAIDVGHDQLAASLRGDPRVVSREGVNARDLNATDFADAIDLIVVDASFISLDKLLPALARVAPAGAELLALVKPQFEVGPAAAQRTRGVVRDAALRESAIFAATRAVEEAGFAVLGGADCRVAGEKGNVEYFVHARRAG